MKIPALSGRQVLLGVSGSIACYKLLEVASKLTQAGAIVDVIMTDAATHFVTPLAFQSVTGRPVHANMWNADAHVLHVGLAERAEVMLIAPATAHTIAKLAHGSADDLLSLSFLSARCPVLFAPAMDGGMFTNPATAANVQTLRARGLHMLGPVDGRMASGLTGLGRMVEPAELIGAVRRALSANGPLAGTRVLVTAGGTQEAIDPVRMITNRSSGKQGFALAQAALDLGADVTLICGPNPLPTPHGAHRIDIQTAAQMADAVFAHAPNADAVIMAAAVADFRPTRAAADKIKKTDVASAPVIELERTTDIIGTLGERRRATGSPGLLVGFAAETRDVVAFAADKARRKGLDFVVANDVSEPGAGFNVDTNRVTFVFPDGRVEPLPLLSKAEVALSVLERVAAALGVRQTNGP
jgi:phosphopantothenoylcysteine decarboxylase/phosphopantothenate--cysteine ligase